MVIVEKSSCCQCNFTEVQLSELEVDFLGRGYIMEQCIEPVVYYKNLRISGYKVRKTLDVDYIVDGSILDPLR
jgi:hypothetical protein